NHVSATKLLNSPRQIILSSRSDSTTTEMDISDLVPSGLGNAVHNAIEAAWKTGYEKSLKRLGYSDSMITRVKINPLPEELEPNTIPIYVEQRTEKEINGFIISGKYDFVGDGELVDHKTTGVYGFMKGSNDEKYALQGSIYRWLNQDIITQDHMIINFFFTDWNKLQAEIQAKKGYPAFRSLPHKVQLLSLSDTEAYIRNKLDTITKYINADEDKLPLCSQEELWQSDAVYAYYKNPNGKRATKNYDNYAEAQTHCIKDGSVGLVKTRKGMVKRCLYCNGINICSQRKALEEQGLLD
nr:hypothetical protein [Thiomicrorhabdus sp.]